MIPIPYSEQGNRDTPGFWLFENNRLESEIELVGEIAAGTVFWCVAQKIVIPDQAIVPGIELLFQMYIDLLIDRSGII